jgi:hypothetical protein
MKEGELFEMPNLFDTIRQERTSLERWKGQEEETDSVIDLINDNIILKEKHGKKFSFKTPIDREEYIRYKERYYRQLNESEWSIIETEDKLIKPLQLDPSLYENDNTIPHHVQLFISKPKRKGTLKDKPKRQKPKKRQTIYQMTKKDRQLKILTETLQRVLLKRVIQSLLEIGTCYEEIPLEVKRFYKGFKNSKLRKKEAKLLTFYPFFGRRRYETSTSLIKKKRGRPKRKRERKYPSIVGIINRQKKIEAIERREALSRVLIDRIKTKGYNICIYRDEYGRVYERKEKIVKKKKLYVKNFKIDYKQTIIKLCRRDHILYKANRQKNRYNTILETLNTNIFVSTLNFKYEELCEFWSWVDIPVVNPIHNCWIWKGKIFENTEEKTFGFGKYEYYDLKINKIRKYIAHRLVFMMYYRDEPISPDTKLIQKCTQKRCCNPNHIVILD